MKDGQTEPPIELLGQMPVEILRIVCVVLHNSIKRVHNLSLKKVAFHMCGGWKHRDGCNPKDRASAYKRCKGPFPE